MLVTWRASGARAEATDARSRTRKCSVAPGSMTLPWWSVPLVVTLSVVPYLNSLDGLFAYDDKVSGVVGRGASPRRVRAAVTAGKQAVSAALQ